MSVQEIYTTLYDFLHDWLTDAEMRDDHDGDLEGALHEYGFDEVDADDLLACLPLVAEDLPAVYQEAIYSELNSMTDESSSGSMFTVNQGGGDSGASQGSGSGGAPDSDSDGGGSDHDHHDDHTGGDESPMDAVVRHIHHIQNVTENNYSYIDDRDVSTTVNALGDVDFDQIVASGDGAIAAGDDVEGVINTGTNTGIMAGDDVEDSSLAHVNGDGNVVGDFGDDATVVSGHDNVLANDSTVIDGDFDGGFIGGDVDADQSALNFGDGDIGQDNSVNDSYNTDNSQHAKDSFNTDNSVNDSGNTNDSGNVDASQHAKDSFNHDLDASINDSGNTNTDASVNDSGNTNDSGNLDVDIEKSFQDNDTDERDNSVNDSGNTNDSGNIDIDVEDDFIDA